MFKTRCGMGERTIPQFNGGLQMLSMRLLCCLAVLACLSGCAVSVHPLYTNDVLVSEPALAGTWEAVAGADGKPRNISLTFRKCENENGKAVPGSYDLEMVRGTKVSLWKAYLIKLDDDLYLDMCPSKVVVKPQTYPEFMLRLHMICRLTVAQDKLTIHYRHDMGRLFRAIKKEQIAHIRRGEQVVFTATTSEVQQFHSKYGKEIFLDGEVFQRKRNAKIKSSSGSIAPMPTSAT